MTIKRVWYYWRRRSGALAYFGYTQFIVKPQEENAQQEMFMAEQYFGQDSAALAINGDGSYPGFQEIIDNYSSAPSGNLANYYLGMSSLKATTVESNSSTRKTTT